MEEESKIPYRDYDLILDKTLDFVYRNNGKVFTKKDLYASILIKNWKDYKMDSIECDQLFLKMIDDGLIKKINEDQYQVLFAGMKFIQEGGYTSLRRWKVLSKVSDWVQIIAIVLGAIVATIYYYNHLTS